MEFLLVQIRRRCIRPVLPMLSARTLWARRSWRRGVVMTPRTTRPRPGPGVTERARPQNEAPPPPAPSTHLLHLNYYPPRHHPTTLATHPRRTDHTYPRGPPRTRPSSSASSPAPWSPSSSSSCSSSSSRTGQTACTRWTRARRTTRPPRGSLPPSSPPRVHPPPRPSTATLRTARRERSKILKSGTCKVVHKRSSPQRSSHSRDIRFKITV